MRGRSYSYSPSPPRGYNRRGGSPSPRGRYGGRSRDLPTSLLVRNLRRDCRTQEALLSNPKESRTAPTGSWRDLDNATEGGEICIKSVRPVTWVWPEDLRRPFGQFGPVKDIYLPRDYHTGEPRGFGFVQFVDPADAQEAKYQMDGQILNGRELTVVFAEENRKKPADMRARERVSGPLYDRRRSPPRYSQSPRYARSRSRSPSYRSPSPRLRNYSRSVSPQDRRSHREPSYSHSPPYNGSRGGSPSRSRSPSRDQSQSPDDYPRKAGRERSLSR